VEVKEFEECKEKPCYDGFMGAALDFDGLTMEDYQAFMPVLFDIVPAREEKDPVEMYKGVIEELRKRWTASQELPFHGPWHHGMIAGIIIAALRNNGYDFTQADVVEALKRGLMIPAGSCGFHGVCGAGTGSQQSHRQDKRDGRTQVLRPQCLHHPRPGGEDTWRDGLRVALSKDRRDVRRPRPEPPVSRQEVPVLPPGWDANMS